MEMTGNPRHRIAAGTVKRIVLDFIAMIGAALE
jgi:hypothetical protein